MYGDEYHQKLEEVVKAFDLTTIEGCKKYIEYLQLRIVMDEITSEQFDQALALLIEPFSPPEHQ